MFTDVTQFKDERKMFNYAVFNGPDDHIYELKFNDSVNFSDNSKFTIIKRFTMAEMIRQVENKIEDCKYHYHHEFNNVFPVFQDCTSQSIVIDNNYVYYLHISYVWKQKEEKVVKTLRSGKGY